MADDPAPVCDVTTARAFILEAQDIHVQWRDYLAANPDDPEAAIVGDAEWHQRWVDKYHAVLTLLEGG